MTLLGIKAELRRILSELLDVVVNDHTHRIEQAIVTNRFIRRHEGVVIDLAILSNADSRTWRLA